MTVAPGPKPPPDQVTHYDLDDDPRVISRVSHAYAYLWICSLCSGVFMDPVLHYAAVHPNAKEPSAKGKIRQAPATGGTNNE